MSGSVIVRGTHVTAAVIDIAADRIARALIVKPAEHFETHEGNHYVSQHSFTGVGAGGTAIVRFKTPAAKYMHTVFSAYASKGSVLKVVEDSTLTHNQSNAIQAINRNRAKAADNTSSIQQICHTPSGTETGTTNIIPSIQLGASGNPFASSPGEKRDSNEYDLKTDTVYSIIVTADGADTDINIGLDWYEEETL